MENATSGNIAQNTQRLPSRKVKQTALVGMLGDSANLEHVLLLMKSHQKRDSFPLAKFFVKGFCK